MGAHIRVPTMRVAGMYGAAAARTAEAITPTMAIGLAQYAVSSILTDVVVTIADTRGQDNNKAVE